MSFFGATFGDTFDRPTTPRWLLVEIVHRVLAQCSAKSRQCYHGVSVVCIGEAVVYDDGDTPVRFIVSKYGDMAVVYQVKQKS